MIVKISIDIHIMANQKSSRESDSTVVIHSARVIRLYIESEKLKLEKFCIELN